MYFIPYNIGDTIYVRNGSAPIKTKIESIQITTQGVRYFADTKNGIYIEQDLCFENIAPSKRELLSMIKRHKELLLEKSMEHLSND